MKGVLKRHPIKATLSMTAVLIISLGSLSACVQVQTTNSLNSQIPVTIGVSLSFSGDFKDDGLAMEQGYLLWANTVNSNGGLLGRPVKLVILDDKSDPDQVAKNYSTLIHTDHVDLVFGPFSSLLTKAAAPVVQNAGYAFVDGAGGAPSVFTNGWKNLFAASLPVEKNLASFAYFILSLPQSIRPKTAAYATSDDPFTYPQIDYARQVLEQGGIKTVCNPPLYDSAKANITSYANQVVQSKADVVLLGTLLPDITTYVKVFKQRHYNPNALIATAGPDLGQDFINAVGGVKNTEGIFVPNGWYPQINNFGNAQMVPDYLAQYGGTIDQINADVAEAYSVGQVLEQAVKIIHSINNSKLISELQSGGAFNTVQGTAQFDARGQNTTALAYLFQWQHGQLLAVYPSFAAAQNPEYTVHS
jgi:branched-chain amino acid transport system substrate-binding protein